MNPLTRCPFTVLMRIRTYTHVNLCPERLYGFTDDTIILWGQYVSQIRVSSVALCGVSSVPGELSARQWNPTIHCLGITKEDYCLFQQGGVRSKVKTQNLHD